MLNGMCICSSLLIRPSLFPSILRLGATSCPQWSKKFERTFCNFQKVYTSCTWCNSWVSVHTACEATFYCLESNVWAFPWRHVIQTVLASLLRQFSGICFKLQFLTCKYSRNINVKSESLTILFDNGMHYIFSNEL